MLCVHSTPSSHGVYYVCAEQIYSTNPVRDKGKAKECSLSQHWHEYVTHSAPSENRGYTAWSEKKKTLYFSCELQHQSSAKRKLLHFSMFFLLIGNLAKNIYI